MVRRVLQFFVLALFALAAERADAASNLRARVVVAIQRLEDRIEQTRWNLNTLAEKKQLQRDLALLKKLYDRIIDHESDLVTLGCSGATIDLDGGPPKSSEASDVIGTLALGGRSAAATTPGGGMPAGGTGDGPAAGSGTLGPIGAVGYQFAFAREITDVEVRLLAEIVYIDDRLANDDWHLNNLEEQRALRAKRASAMAALRRVRNSGC